MGDVFDGKWHAWCAYWDVSGTVKLYKDGVNVFSGKHHIRGRRLQPGGTWVIGQDQDGIGRGFDATQSYTGEITNVNVYANFDTTHFQQVAGPAISSNTCQLKYSKNILKCWDDFKLGFVGNQQTMVKNSPCSDF